MLAIGATKAKKMNASKGATSRKLTRRRRSSALRSWSISLLLKEPLIDLLAQVFVMVRPEDAVRLQSGFNMGSWQVVDYVFVHHIHGGTPWRAVSDILEAGQRLGGGREGDKVQRFLQLGCALHNAPGVQVVQMAVPNNGEGLVLATDSVKEAAVGRLNKYGAAVIEQLRGL